MDYSIYQEGRYAIVVLGGDIDLATSPAAREAIMKPLKAGKDVLVELSGVTYMDSSGVAGLVEGYQLSRRRGLEFGLVAVSDSALAVLRLARLDAVFPIHASVAAAGSDDAQ